MIGRTHWKVVLAGFAILTLTVAERGWAHSAGRGDGLGVPGHGMVHFGPVVEELIFPPCQCAQDKQTCVDAAEKNLLACAQATCTGEITLAKTDCTASRTSQACLTDVTNLITCIQTTAAAEPFTDPTTTSDSCMTEETAALALCSTNFSACASTCPTPVPRP